MRRILTRVTLPPRKSHSNHSQLLFARPAQIIQQHTLSSFGILVKDFMETPSMVHQARPIIRKRRRVSIPEETQNEIPISNSSGRQTFSDGSDFEGTQRPKRARKPRRSRNLENDPKTKLLAQDSKSPTKSTKGSVPSPSSKSPKMAKYDYSQYLHSPTGKLPVKRPSKRCSNYWKTSTARLKYHSQSHLLGFASKAVTKKNRPWSMQS